MENKPCCNVCRGKEHDECISCTCVDAAPERKEKIERGAEDFANRFEGVMKELAEEESTPEKKCCDGEPICLRGRREGCKGFHCRCMGKDCNNMHYADCKEHYIHRECAAPTQTLDTEKGIIEDILVAFEQGKKQGYEEGFRKGIVENCISMDAKMLAAFKEAKVGEPMHDLIKDIKEKAVAEERTRLLELIEGEKTRLGYETMDFADLRSKLAALNRIKDLLSPNK